MNALEAKLSRISTFARADQAHQRPPYGVIISTLACRLIHGRWYGCFGTLARYGGKC